MTLKSTFKDIDTVYCAGCSYGLINKLIAETIDVLGLREKTIIVNSQGCTSFGSDYLNVDFIEAPAGMATSVATGLKKVYPEKIIITYQGDGDLLFSGNISNFNPENKFTDTITFYLLENKIYKNSEIVGRGKLVLNLSANQVLNNDCSINLENLKLFYEQSNENK